MARQAVSHLRQRCVTKSAHPRLPCCTPAFTGTPTEDELRERELFLARQQQERVQLQQQAAADLLPDPLQAVADVVSAYTAEQGFREMGVQELSVALTAGGLIDLLLDVRSHEEFTAGG